MKCDKWVFSELKDDIRAAITFLVEFAASKSNRIAVWRSALPQHFNTTDGHYQKGKTCSLAQLLLQNHPTETRKGNGVTRQAIQNYNQAYDEVFGDSCEPVPGSCNGLTYQHSCTMNLTSTNYRTVYKYLLDSNVTEGTHYLQKNNITEGLRHYGRMMRSNHTNIMTANVLRWNVADLFDVPIWHAGSMDCSHFCYVPNLYEAAFERLSLLLAGYDNNSL